MDDYMFKNHVQGCKNVVENTSYLEIFNYSVGNFLYLYGGGEALAMPAPHQTS
jgi:hypothetical protein